MSELKTTVHDEIRCSYQRDEEGHLIEDAPCIRCEYNLRGLTVDMTCPECGLPVGRSAVGEYLRYRDPKWLNKITDGFLCFAVLLMLCDLFAMLVYFQLLNSTNLGLVVIAISIVTAVTMFFYGVVLATAKEPDNTRDQRLFSMCVMSRILLFTFPFVFLLVLLMAFVITVAWRGGGYVFAFVIILLEPIPKPL